MHEKFLLPKYIFDWKGALVLFLGVLIPQILVAFLNVFAVMVLHTNYQYTAFFSLVAYIFSFGGAVFAYDYFICRPQTGKPLNFNFSTKDFYTYLLIFPMMFGMMLIGEFFTAQIPVTGPFWGKFYDLFNELMMSISNDNYVMIAMAVICAPILEEIIFRGIIQKGMINNGVKPANAIFISAVVFGLVHGNPWQFVGAVLLGSVLGLVYYKTKSLLMPILLHAFNNLTSSILIMKGKTESFGETFHVSEWMVLASGILIFGVFYYLFMQKYKTEYS